jgi:hypothetical protein
MTPSQKFVCNVLLALAVFCMIGVAGFLMSLPDIVRNKTIAERHESIQENSR